MLTKGNVEIGLKTRFGPDWALSDKTNLRRGGLFRSLAV